jgi:hypothetical protein
VKISSNQFVDNNGVANNLKTNEEGNKESMRNDSDDVHHYYEDDNNEGEEADEEDENFKVNEYRSEDELDDSNNDDGDDMSEFVHDRLGNKDARSGENVGSEHETELLRVTRGHAFEYSGNSTKTTTKFDDNNNRISYNYDDVKNHDDDNDDHSDGWSTREEDNGVREVADYIVDYIRNSSGDEGGGKRRCLFGWRLDANGVCAPRRRQCEPGFLRNEEGNCVAPEEGYWYK